MRLKITSTQRKGRKMPSMVTPVFMKESAARGLRLHEEGLSGDGLMPATVADARRMANGEELSEAKWRKIGPWIARHIVDLDAVQGNEITAGLVAMLLWGGGSSKASARRAQAYAERIVAQIDEEREQEEEQGERSGKSFKVVRKAASKVTATRKSSLVGKPVEVSCPNDGKAFGVVASQDGEKLVVKLAIPSADGVLMVTDSTTEVTEDSVRAIDAKVAEGNVKRFDSVNVLADCKVGFREVRRKANPEGFNQYTGGGGTTGLQADKASGSADRAAKDANKATRAAGGNPPNSDVAQDKLRLASEMLRSSDRASIAEGHALATEGHVGLSEAHAAQAQIAMSLARAGDSNMLGVALKHTEASVAHTNAASAHAAAAKLHADLDEREKTVGGAPNVRALPESYRPAVSSDVPEGRACGNCAAYNEERINPDGVSVWCERWADWVRGDHYCDGWAEGKTAKGAKFCKGQKLTPILDNDGSDMGEVEDYRDVTFEGYASTFAAVTAADRQGDNIVEGAFTKTIAKFMENPVMLIDHENSVHQIAGSYERLSQNGSGLAVRGKVSNAPRLKDIRFLIAEGHLRALSIGGMFRYDVDGRTILEIELFEISLVAVPANPDALFSVRKISIDDATKAYKKFAVAGKKLQPL